jgi:hypothetical protein
LFVYLRFMILRTLWESNCEVWWVNCTRLLIAPV